MCSANIVVEVGAVAAGEVVPVDEPDAFVLERGRDLLGEHRGLAGDELVGAGADGAELVDEVEAVGRGGAQARRELLDEAGDPHLEELVEVVAEDGEELHALEQRSRGVLGEREHAGVEGEPGELAVQEPAGIRWPRRARRASRGVVHRHVQPSHRTTVATHFSRRLPEVALTRR